MNSLQTLCCAVMLCACANAKHQTANTAWHNEQHRPQIHFTPKKAWMNDPNGMVFHNGVYHLFYQHYPDSTVWGPMHWGHATSKDLVHWEHQPIALYPDSLGYIFSGSAVVDANNTSGFGADGKTPLVAVFTHHDPKGERAGSDTFQTQSIAYSLDEGKTWTKHAANPVIKNPGIRDFRDPKVLWHEGSKRWVMALAVKDRISFYSSPDLKEWTKESDFGETVGAHGGVWECPELLPLERNGETVWVLLVSINPGGPNGGSATQYFTGAFDGHSFTPYQTDVRWIDYGPDNYAGVTWSNTGKRKIFLGWMSNWQYAAVVPTASWRSAMTVPRDLGLQKTGEKWFVTSRPVAELDALVEKTKTFENVNGRNLWLASQETASPMKIALRGDKLQSFSLTLSNTKGQKVVMGYDGASNQYFIDRSASGKTGFEKGFAKKHFAPRLTTGEAFDLTILLDKASAEIFADGGLTVLTQIFFPDEDFSNIQLQSPQDFTLKSLRVSKLKSIHRGAQIALQ